MSIARFDHASFRVDDLLAAKAARPTSTTMLLPARDEAATIGAIVEVLAAHPLVDEVVVVDDHSRDDTARCAADAGARVVDASTTLVEHGEGPGKGQALWKGVAAAQGDVVACVDADLRDFSAHYVVGLLGPLLTDPSIGFVKAYYDRPGDGHPRGGGRVTELVARPLLHLLHPHLADLVQPLAGEFAGRRHVFEAIPFVEGYGVDVAMLLDIAATFGVASMAQVDLGIRLHRNRPLHELGPMATVVLMAMLQRAGIREVPSEVVLHRPEADPATVALGERPPLASLR